MTTLAERLAAAGAQVDVDTSFARRGFPWSIVFAMFMLAAIIGAMIFMQRQQAKAAGAQQDRHTKKDRKQGDLPAVRFSDVAGCDEAVQEAAELVEFLKRPEAYQRLGAKMPSGLMLYGPPGTGKTLLAKAVAGEAGASFYAVSGSEFVEMYVGVGAGRVRDLFAKARANGPAIVFIDEVDAIGAKRGGGPRGRRQPRGRPDPQPAAGRDGRLQRQRAAARDRGHQPPRHARSRAAAPRPLLAPHPRRRADRGRPPEILNVHAKGKPLGEDVDLPLLAKVTAGSSGAELAEMLNEGAIMAARAEHAQITHEDLFEGFLRVVAGPRKASAMLAAGERETIAYHEAGHVLCAELCPTVDKTLHATINPRGQAAGFAVVGRSDRALHTAQHIHEQLIYILGGRAAEHVIDGTVSSGAANDLEKANAIARAAVEQYGLSAAVGQVVATQSGFSEPTRATVDSEVRRIVEDAYRDAIHMVTGAPRAARAPHPGPADRRRHRPPRDRRGDGGLDRRRPPPEPAAAPARARAGVRRRPRGAAPRPPLGAGPPSARARRSRRSARSGLRFSIGRVDPGPPPSRPVRGVRPVPVAQGQRGAHRSLRAGAVRAVLAGAAVRARRRRPAELSA